MIASKVILERKEMYTQVDIALSKAKQIKQRMIVLLINLDRFYEVNETRGNLFGNRVLDEVSKRLKASLPNEAMVARIDGNSFLVALPILNEAIDASTAVEALKYVVERPVDDNGTEIYLTASIGAAHYPQDSRVSEQLISHAETALHESKSQGGNRITFYQADDNKRLMRKSIIAAGLRPALYMQQFHIHYQPIYALGDGKLRGFEARIRWNHSELGTIEPEEFLPLAEDNGLINPIGEWVIREACKMLKSMKEYGVDELNMVLQVSALQLSEPSFAKTVRHLVQEYELSPAQMTFSVIESAGGGLPELAVSALGWLRAAGASVYLNRFGHGVTALSHLYQLPINGLVLDKIIVQAIEKDGAERIIIESLIVLAHKLGMKVTAAGIDSEKQYQLLKSWGCDYVQGFLLGKPKELNVLDLSMIRK